LLSTCSGLCPFLGISASLQYFQYLIFQLDTFEGVRSDQNEATVVGVNKVLGTVKVQIGDTQYETLTAAAVAVSGYMTNGWVYWGLKKQIPYRKPTVSKSASP